jgi:alpha-beta hydrolase superfamily lysophospholipase
MNEQLTAALTHWSHRMVANGVPYADLVEVQAEITAWDDWCRAWAERGAVHEALGDEAEASGHPRSAAQHWTDAAVCCHFGKFLTFGDRPLARKTAALAVACRRRALPYLDPPGERVEIGFEGTVLPGNLRLPRGVGQAPLVVMAMGLDSAKEEMHGYEQDFLARGLATFAFDGPGQGEVEEQLPIRADYEVPVAALLDVLVDDPRIDAGRIAIWGVSLGGYYAPRAAAFDPRLTACVSLSGCFDLGDAWEGMPDLSREAFRVRSHSASAAEAAARARALTLEDVARRITCPVLVVSGGHDRIFPPPHAARLVSAVRGPVDHLHVEDGTHVSNNRPFRYRPQSADWLADVLKASDD